MVEKSGVEKFLFALGLKSSWLKSPGLKGLGLKLGVEKSGVEMSFNRFDRLLESQVFRLGTGRMPKHGLNMKFHLHFPQKFFLGIITDSHSS